MKIELSLVLSALLGIGTAACSADGETLGGAPQQLGVDSAARRTPTVPTPANSYTLFETLQVRPLALSPNGKVLFAANTPDNRLEIFRVGPHGLEPSGSVSVGLEPIAVAARSNDEVWVVNHLSDSVSVVDLKGRGGPRVVRTLLVGDEPRDIVFAGPKKNLASSPPPIAGKTPPTTRTCSTPQPAAPTCGCSMPTTSGAAWLARGLPS